MILTNFNLFCVISVLDIFEIYLKIKVINYREKGDPVDHPYNNVGVVTNWL